MKRTTTTFLLTASFALLAASAFAGVKPISGTYAESGLVARWDAIDNSGTGTHNSSTTTWKDLAGDNDMTIVSSSGAGWRNGNALYLNSLANGVCPAYGKSGNTTYKTIEIVYKKATSKGRLLWCGGVDTRYVAFDYTDTAAPWKNAKVYFDGSARTTKHTLVSSLEPTSLVALYSDAGAVTSIYRDGVESNAGDKPYNTWSVDGNSTMVRLGSRSKTNTSQNTTQGWEGEVYTIRLYDRQLTPLEIACNHTLDAARFFGAGFTTNVIVATAVDGLEGSEASGMYMIDAAGHEFSAPLTATKNGTIYDCTGYTLETWNGSSWSAPASYSSCSYTTSDTSAKVRLTWQWAPAEIVAQDYTWMASPANAAWDGTSANWNSGEAWADGNNAVFGTSSQTTLTVGSERLVNDLTVNNVAYTFNGTGPLRVKGTITPVGAKDQHFNVPLASGRDDGSLHFTATGVDWRSAYLDSVNNLQASTMLGGTVFLMAKGDGSFGPAPATPMENVVIESGNPTIYGNATVTIHSNRIVRIKSGAALWTGSNSPFTYKAQIVADPEDGSDYSEDTQVKIRSNWGGLVTLDPGADRTNAFGRLFIDTRRLKLASGTTVVTGPATSTGESAITYVKGNGSAFSTDRGYLLIDGGELSSPKMADNKDRYVDVGAYGQVVVTNGGKVTMPEGVQWINGLTTPGKLTVTQGGSLAVEQLRVSQSGANQSEVHLDEGGLIAVHQLRMDNASTGLFAFNGGCLQATKENRAFYAGAAANWANVAFTVGEKGAGFDLSNGVNLWWGKTLASGVGAGETDGGLFKRGSGILVLLSANAYNGPTVLESGRIQARADNALPSGTTLRLGGADVRLSANSYDSEAARRDTLQTIGRLEGCGELDYMTASSVTGAIAPSADGTINFLTTCALSGDYEVTADANGCSCLKVATGQDISGLAVKLMNPSALDREADRDAYKILDAPEGYIGKFDAGQMPESWHLRHTATAVYLSPITPFVLVIR